MFLTILYLSCLPATVSGDGAITPSGEGDADTDTDTDADTDDDTGADTDDDTGEACGVAVTTLPLQGSVSAYYRGDVEFRFTKPDATAVIETDIPGSQELSADGLTLYWRLSQPLRPETAYFVALDYCSGRVELPFTTSALGTPISRPDELAGRTYELSLGEARFTQPEGLGSLLDSELDWASLFAHVVRADDELVILGAVARVDDPTTQEYCDVTTEFPGADFDGSPHFEVGGVGEAYVDMAGVGLPIIDPELSGDFAPDLSYFGGGTVSGMIDTRPLDADFFDGEEGAMCRTLAALGVECEVCPDGASFCLPFVADSITAPLVDVIIVPIDGMDCEGCVEGPPPDATAECRQDPDAP